MPYIPPPRPPPAPRPPVFRPPVFRPPPGPNLHQQQLRRQQQQQQQFRQQQQFHQTQQQFLANQQRMQMDQRQRQQQDMLRQQQLRQQQENLHRQQQLQQENQRRQQQQHQDHLRRQQQFHHNQQEQLRRQQQLLQGLQSSSGTAGSSVYISPASAFSLEISGLGIAAGGTDSGGAVGNFGGNPQGAYQPPPSALPPQQATPFQQSLPTDPGRGAEIYPPPYSATPQSLPFSPTQSLPQQHVPPMQPLPPKLDTSLQPYQPIANGGSQTTSGLKSNGGPLVVQHNEPVGASPRSSAAAVKQPTADPQAARNKVVLRDGTCITIRGRDEYLFVGPQGHQMVVNCLPLFTPRPVTGSLTAGASGGASSSSERDAHNQVRRRGTKAMRRFVLKKAASTENLLAQRSDPATAATKNHDRKRSSEAEDILSENARKNVHVHRDMWTVFSKTDEQQASDYSNCEGVGEVSKAILAPEDPPTTQTPAEELKILSDDDDGERGSGVEDRGVREMVEGGVSVGVGGGELEGDGNVINGGEKGGGDGALGDDDTMQQHAFSGSDGENEKELRVNYIENPEQMKTLKRSSGSVSFIGTASSSSRGKAAHSPPPPLTVEGVKEEEEEEEEVQEEEGSEPTGMVGGITEDKPTPKIQPLGTGPGSKTTGVQESDHLNGEIGTEVSQSPESSWEPLPHLVPPSPTTEDTPAHPPMGTEQQTLPQQPVTTPLPPPPRVFEPEFIERSGWLMKLSHRRGVFGDKWQKRYFVLHGSWIYYFKKYGDSIPRGAIRLHPGAWVKSVAQGTARQSDAVAKTPPNAIISVVRCFGVHRPDNFASSLTNLLSQEGVAEAFRSQTISVSKSDSRSRTFYMIAPSNEERDAWVDAIHNNIRAHALSDSALETSCKELKNMLRAINSFPPSSDLPPLLFLLHTRTRELNSSKKL